MREKQPCGTFRWRLEIEYRDPTCRQIRKAVKIVSADSETEARETIEGQYRLAGIPAWVTKARPEGRNY